jgi:hypothetical protein
MADQKTTEQKNDTAAPKSQRTRSPAYPSYNLEASLEKAKLVWEQERRNSAAVAVIAAAWELNPKSSSTMLYVSSLKKFGLLEEVEGGSERGLRLSQAALNIILNEQSDSPERIALLKQCALTPRIHAELWQKYDGELPSDANLKRHLIVEKNFNADASDKFINQFKETIAFAKLLPSDKITVVEPQESEQPKETLKTQQKVEPKLGAGLGAPLSLPGTSLQDAIKFGSGSLFGGASLTGAMTVLREFTVPLTSGAVSLRVPYPMEDEDFQLFMDTLKLWKKRLVRTAKAIPPKILLPANATWSNNDTDKPVKIVAVMGEKDGELYYQSEDGTGIPASQLTF